MVLIIFGAPGVGKGSQANILSNTLQIPHISTGDIFRENVSNGTELGRIVKGYMDQGALVPDNITISLIMDRIRKDDCTKGFILDGFPRTMSQAEHLDTMLIQAAININAIVNIILDDDEIISRLTGRRICPSCNLVYHLKYKKPVHPGRCNKCKNRLVQREDDTESTIYKRLRIYHAQTESLLSYYRNVHMVFDVKSQAEITETTKHIFDALCIEEKDGAFNTEFITEGAGRRCNVS